MPTTAAETRSAQSGSSSAHNSAGRRSATNNPRILHGSTQLLSLHVYYGKRDITKVSIRSDLSEEWLLNVSPKRQRQRV
jgi:hypothetical protein